MSLTLSLRHPALATPGASRCKGPHCLHNSKGMLGLTASCSHIMGPTRCKPGGLRTRGDDREHGLLRLGGLAKYAALRRSGGYYEGELGRGDVIERR
eukprot:scaffold585_cov311-Prasinococcus_capsulatus_cf.AAC.5